MKDIVIITGGAGGMGLAVAKKLIGDYRIMISDINTKRLDDAVNELKDIGGECVGQLCDVSNNESVQQLFNTAAGMGKVVSVIHTAGVSPQMATPEVILKVNALGTLYITQQSLNIATEGFSLINVASMAGHMLPRIMSPKFIYRRSSKNGSGFLSMLKIMYSMIPSSFYRRGLAYCISKNYVIWLCKAMASDFGNKGARIVSVSPGSFDTEMGRLEEKSGSAQMLEKAALKRFGRVEEIADLLVFCASREASYITGVDILCDGGVIASRS